MILPEPGQPPRWGEGGYATPADRDIEAAAAGTVEQQEKVFFRCARHLFDNQVRENVTDRMDPTNNEAWLTALGAWFGWDESRIDAAVTRAVNAAWPVLPHEKHQPTTDDN